LTDVARLESGHTPSKRNPEYWGGSIPWISLNDTDGLDTWELQTTSQTITEAGLANSSARLLPKGTVVFSRTATVGKSTVMGCSMATSQDFACYVCGPEVHNFYLALLLKSMRAEWKKLMAGSIHNTVYMPVFKTLSVDLPPHDEQVAVAEALLDVKRHIDSLDQLLTKKCQIKQGAMQELLTGKRRLHGFSESWSEGTLGQVVAELVAGVSVNSDATQVSTGVPSVVKTSAMKGGVFDPTECKPIIQTDLARATTSLRKDTLLISRMNTPDLVGEVGYVDQDYDWLYLPDRIWMTRMRLPDCVCVRWLGFLLSSAQYKRRIGDAATGTSGSMKNIAKGALLSVPVSFPKVDEQIAIAQVLADMEADIAVVQSRLTKARALKQAMAQALLTGRIRLMESNAWPNPPKATTS
jgi:type I restriction enzyme S subunit